ncbi:SAM-dependent methyltransferase [Nonomuraea sp. NPDC059023]|uniref:SAM-dependent methyltransferase n=1 Tax=unclassified Nonomuraea TaxID=2593643 RepID=UPI00367FE796
MTENQASAGTPPLAKQPSIARTYDGFLKGKNHYLNEDAVVDELLGILPQLQQAAMANAAFVPRAIQVACEEGVHQFLDLGCGLPSPTGATTLETARQVQREPRVVYVDNDRQVAVHGRALLEVTGEAIMVEADVRHADFVLAEASKLVDFDQPVAVIAAAVAHFWPDQDDPAAVLRRYTDRCSAGGFVIFTHARGDLLPRDLLGEGVAAYSKIASIYPRSIEAIAGFLDGFELLEPGLVEASQWRPPHEVKDDVGPAHFLAAVARFGPAPGR